MNTSAPFHKDKAREILGRVQQDARLQKKLEKLDEKFRYKPRLERDQSLRWLAQGGKFLFSGISIALAYYFVFQSFREALNIWELSLVLALLLLFFIEFLKHITLPKILNHCLLIQHQIQENRQADRQYYKTENYRQLRKQAIPFPFLIFNLLLVALSIYLSVKGIARYHQEEMALPPVLINEDSLQKSYEQRRAEAQKMYSQQIALVQSEEKAFRASISWKGKIDMYHPSNQKLLTGYQQQIQSLQQNQSRELEKIRKDQEKVLRKAEQYNESQMKTSEKTSQIQSWNLIGFASLSELGCILCLYFLCISNFKAFQEIKLAEKSLKKGANQIPTANKEKKATNPTKNPTLGFEIAATTGKKLAKTEKQRRILEMYFEKNLKKIEIHKITGVSRTTIDKVIAEYHL
ncbi:MAG: hypothetical protein AAFU64_01140 [Bacteroidota bacterium]